MNGGGKLRERKTNMKDLSGINLISAYDAYHKYKISRADLARMFNAGFIRREETLGASPEDGKPVIKYFYYEDDLERELNALKNSREQDNSVAADKW